MHASLFNLDLGSCATTSDRARHGRALGAALATSPGFVAFIALEAKDGTATGLCVCVDEQALESVRQVVAEWQRGRSAQVTRGEEAVLSPELQALVTGEVIVQRGF